MPLRTFTGSALILCLTASDGSDASPWRDPCVCVPLPQAMVETVNNLLQPRVQAAWRELPTSEQLHSATLLLDTVETGAFMLADNLLKTDTVQESTDNIRKSHSVFPSRLSWLKSLLSCPLARHLTSICSC